MTNWKGTLCVAAALLITACGVKVSSDADQAPQDKGIAGPDLTGQWQTGCEADWRSSGYKTVVLKFKAPTVSRQARLYADRACLRQTDEKIENGTFKYVAADKDGGYTIEYKFPVGNGWSALPKEKVLLEGDTLFIGDYQIGDAVTKNSMLPMKRVTP